MSEETKDVQAEELNNAQAEQEVIEAVDYKEVLANYAQSAQNLGQIIWVDNIDENSNKINIVRVLSDGTKQLFSVVVSEEQELAMKK